MAESALQLVDESLGRDDYNSGKKLAEIASTAVAKAKDRQLLGVFAPDNDPPSNVLNVAGGYNGPNLVGQ